MTSIALRAPQGQHQGEAEGSDALRLCEGDGTGIPGSPQSAASGQTLAPTLEPRSTEPYRAGWPACFDAVMLLDLPPELRPEPFRGRR